MVPKTTILLSGGLDSTCLLYSICREHMTEHSSPGEVHLLTVFYGQRHSVEMRHALAVYKQAKADFPEIKFELHEVLMGAWAGLMRGSGSSQTDPDVAVPEGHYAEENMKKTVVPNRNMVMLAIAASYCIAHDIPTLAYAAHAGDHTIYPDCRPEFVDRMAEVLMLCDWKTVNLRTPFLHGTKGSCIKMAPSNTPYQLTWSCYKGTNIPIPENEMAIETIALPAGLKHCGKCGACTERKEAFKEAGVQDPTVYAE